MHLQAKIYHQIQLVYLRNLNLDIVAWTTIITYLYIHKIPWLLLELGQLLFRSCRFQFTLHTQVAIFYFLN